MENEITAWDCNAIVAQESAIIGVSSVEFFFKTILSYSYILSCFY